MIDEARYLYTEVFRFNSTEATFHDYRMELVKSVRTEQWFQAPASPYAVRVSITTDGEHDYVLKIINLQSNEILSLKLCGLGNEPRSLMIGFHGLNLYFDCFTLNDSADNITLSERPRKTVEDETKSHIQYHKNGYNYTKEYLDTRDFVGKSYVMYEYKFRKSTKDWCPDEPQPEVLVTWKYADDSFEGMIERSNAQLHSDLQKLNVQNNATADTNAAVLNELKVISDALTTHLRQNATNVNNSNYSNKQLNVTDFLKQN